MNEIKELIIDILQNNNAITVATTGGELSPWIASAYYVSKDMDIYLMLETHAKTFANIKLNKNIAVAIDRNDATQDFLQGHGTVTVLSDTDEAKVREMLVEKMPWYQTFTPMTPVKIDIKKFFVTSLQRQWFPAKVLEN